jgi:hypothetical protein
MKTPDTQATISWQCFLHVRGFDDGERIFTIEHGDDNLVSGTTIIDTAGPEHKLPVTWSPGQNSSDSIKRQPEILVPEDREVLSYLVPTFFREHSTQARFGCRIRSPPTTRKIHSSPCPI